MKILYLSSLFPPAVGGAENYVKWTTEELAKQGEKVSVFTANALHTKEFSQFKPGQLLPEEDMLHGVYIRRFAIQHWINTLVSSKTDKIRGAYRIKQMLFKEALGFWQHGPVVEGMLEAIGRHQPDLMVAVNNYFYTTYIGYIAKKRFGIPLVVIPLSHVSDSWSSAPILRKIYEAADGIIVSTEFEKKFLINQGTKEEKIHIIGHGIDPKEFEGTDGNRFKIKHRMSARPVVSFIGRKITGKGVLTLIRAMRLVWKSKPQAQLALVGPGGDEPHSLVAMELNQLTPQQRAKTYNIEQFSDQEKKDIFAASDIFVMPSNVDSFGLVYLEAWRSGLPVIACRKTAQESFMTQGVNALLVDFEDSEQLAHAILLLLEDKELRRSIGQNGLRKFFAEHTLDIYISRLKKVYSQVLHWNQQCQVPCQPHTTLYSNVPKDEFI